MQDAGCSQHPTCIMFSAHGFMASYSPVGPGTGGTSTIVLKYTVPSDATSKSSAKMISEPGIWEADGLTRFASMVVKPLVPFTRIRPCIQMQNMTLWNRRSCASRHWVHFLRQLEGQRHPAWNMHLSACRCGMQQAIACISVITVGQYKSVMLLHTWTISQKMASPFGYT